MSQALISKPAWPKQDRASMNAFYGNPDLNGDGMPDRDWEARNLTLIKPPYRMVLAWDPSKPVSVIRCHKKVSASLLIILDKIASHYGTQSALEAARLHLYGGAYNFRMMRGAARLSIHSWGAAIDLDPGHNPYGGTPTMDPAVVAIFEAEGATWGGKWSGRERDGMHYQFADV